MEHEELWDSIAATRKSIRNLRTESREDDAVLTNELQELREAINDLIAADRAIHHRLQTIKRQVDEFDAENARLQADNMDLDKENERLKALNDDHHSHNAYLYQEAKKLWL